MELIVNQIVGLPLALRAKITKLMGFWGDLKGFDNALAKISSNELSTLEELIVHYEKHSAVYNLLSEIIASKKNENLPRDPNNSEDFDSISSLSQVEYSGFSDLRKSDINVVLSRR